MYLIANKGLGMSAGKLSAQVAHAAVRAAWMNRNTDVVEEWFSKGETKIVLEARDTQHLWIAQNYIARYAGIESYMVIDEGRTEVPALSATVLGCQIVDKTDERVQFAFETFSTYRDPKPEVVETGAFAPRDRFWSWWWG
jgi:PTH2 family peptidyl-tRNA hydrolase